MGVREDFDDAMRSIQHSDILKQLQFSFAEIDRLTAELARMRPVVEAATEYRDEFCADCGDGGCEATDCKLARAVDVYRDGAGKGGK